jgi:hypothetical protein
MRNRLRKKKYEDLEWLNETSDKTETMHRKRYSLVSTIGIAPVFWKNRISAAMTLCTYPAPEAVSGKAVKACMHYWRAAWQPMDARGCLHAKLAELGDSSLLLIFPKKIIPKRQQDHYHSRCL